MSESTFLNHLSEPESYTTPPLSIDPQNTIDQKLVCPRCGRDLQGLLAIDRCPGCGRLNSRNLYGDALRYCDPIWIKELARGSKLVLNSIIVWIVSLGLGLIGIVIYLALGGSDLPDPSLMLPFVILMSIPHLIMLYGMWRMTTPDPDRLDLESKITARSLARIGIIISLATMPLMFVEGFLVEPGVLKPPSIAIYSVEITSFTLRTLYKIAYIAGIVYLGCIAGRLTYPSYEHSFRIVAWGYGISMVLSLPDRVLSSLIIPFASRGGQSVTSSIPDSYLVQYVFYICIHVFISTIFLVLAIGLMIRLHRHLKNEFGSVTRNRAVE